MQVFKRKYETLSSQVQVEAFILKLVEQDKPVQRRFEELARVEGAGVNCKLINAETWLHASEYYTSKTFILRAIAVNILDSWTFVHDTVTAARAGSGIKITCT